MVREIAAVELAQHRGHTQFSFDITTHRKRTHRFSCSNEQDLVDWVTVLEALIWGEVEQITLSGQRSKVNKVTTIQNGADDSDSEDDNDDEKEDEEERPRPTTPTIRGSVSMIATKFKQLTTSSRGNSPRHSGPYVATMTHID